MEREWKGEKDKKGKRWESINKERKIKRQRWKEIDKERKIKRIKEREIKEDWGRDIILIIFCKVKIQNNPFNHILPSPGKLQA